ncbi:Uncharacterised protein [Streptococcus pneumoniae]|nr:Uncharacterised protein [Streptococcus pneumoniae]
MTLNYIEILIKLVLTLKWLNNNVHFVKRLIDGKPTLLIKNGNIDPEQKPVVQLVCLHRM